MKKSHVKLHQRFGIVLALCVSLDCVAVYANPDTKKSQWKSSPTPIDDTPVVQDFRKKSASDETNPFVDSEPLIDPNVDLEKRWQDWNSSIDNRIRETFEAKMNMNPDLIEKNFGKFEIAFDIEPNQKILVFFSGMKNQKLKKILTETFQSIEGKPILEYPKRGESFLLNNYESVTKFFAYPEKNLKMLRNGHYDHSGIRLKNPRKDKIFSGEYEQYLQERNK